MVFSRKRLFLFFLMLLHSKLCSAPLYKNVGMIFKLSLNSNERKKAEGKKWYHGGGKKVHIRFDICTIKKPLAVSYNLK